MTNYHALPDLNPTTRCFPRSLLQAWPNDHPEWFEPHERKSHGISVWLGLGCWVIGALAYWRYVL
jgi:hypothetical protein